MTAEILIVDDNIDIRNILNDLISDHGFKTRVAANYNQALNEIDKKLPDVASLVALPISEVNEELSGAVPQFLPEAKAIVLKKEGYQLPLSLELCCQLGIFLLQLDALHQSH